MSVSVDVEEQVQKLWAQRTKDRESATRDADRRHGEVMRAIHDVKSETKRINGRVAQHDIELTAIKAVEAERLRVATERKGQVGPSGLADSSAAKAAVLAGGGGGAITAILLAGRVLGLW